MLAATARKTNALILTAWLLLCSRILAAPLVTNGDFETGDLSGWSGSGIVTCFTDPSQAHSGNSGAAFFAFISPAQLFQDIATVVGHQYLVQFWAATADVPFSSTFDASFAGASISMTPSLAVDYTLYSFVVTANSNLSTLSFDTNPDPQGATADVYFLDDVSITDLSAPEVDPSRGSAPLALATACLLLAQGRRRVRADRSRL